MKKIISLIMLLSVQNIYSIDEQQLSTSNPSSQPVNAPAAPASQTDNAAASGSDLENDELDSLLSDVAANLRAKQGVIEYSETIALILSYMTCEYSSNLSLSCFATIFYGVAVNRDQTLENFSYDDYRISCLKLLFDGANNSTKTSIREFFNKLKEI
jgi:hypothetical protein